MNVVNLYKEYRTTFMPTVMSKATNAIKETTVIVQQSDTNIAVIRAGADSEAIVTTGTASANAAKKKIEADSGALKLLKADLLSNNAQVLQYLWSQTLRDDTHSKLLIGLDSNPAIVST